MALRCALVLCILSATLEQGDAIPGKENLTLIALSRLLADRHLLAIISLIGMILDVLGGLYLAYDLLGGVHGPLRLLTRIVTYMLFFLVGYGLFLGPIFGLVVGGGFGLALGLEYGRKQGKLVEDSSAAYRLSLLLGAFRGMVLGLAGALTFGLGFGMIFGVLAGGGLVVQYALGFSPRGTYGTGRKPFIRRPALIASALRCCSAGGAGIIAGLVAGEGNRAVVLGLRVGVVVGVVSMLVSLFSPSVEWWADHLPAHRLGVFGTILLLLGFGCQSVQYGVTLLNFPLR